MRWIVNENVSGTVIRALRERGHDVLSVKESLRGSADAEILARAQADQLESQCFRKRTEARRAAAETAENVAAALETMDQTDEGEAIVKTLVRLIEEKRLKVKVYTKGRLHAKAYIFTYGEVFDGHGQAVERHEKGIAVVGSSNLTLSGVTHNTELNVIVQGNDDRDILWDDDITGRLADFQKVAVRQAVQMIRDYGGAFVADVVGLGKSYIGSAVVKHFERTDHARPLIICPAALTEMWERYNEVYELNARVLSMGYLREDGDGGASVLMKDVKYKDRDFVLVDESHNFRYPDTQRYRVVQEYLATGRRCCFLTATPRNKSAWDVYSQIKLFHQDDKTDLPVDPPDLKEYFRLIERAERKLPDLLVNILIRRTRNHILRWYGFDAQTHEPVDPSNFRPYLDGRRRAYVLVAGRHQFFPKRELETIEYSIEDTYQGLYQQLRGYLGKGRKKPAAKPPAGQLTYARYGLFHYVDPAKQRREPYASLHRAGANLRGLVRVLLFKRFESSVHAFRETVRRLLRVHESFVAALDDGLVPAGKDAEKILYESDYDEEADLLAALRQASGRYRAADFDVDRLREHIEHDIRLFKKILKLVEPITAEQDAKLQTLKDRLKRRPLKDGKRLIFSQYADTAQYLYDNLNRGVKRDDIEVIYSGDKSKVRVVGRFAPLANPEYEFAPGEAELMTVVATDVLAEGLNLQDCDKIINYDLHWNPVRLIQRFGRIDRIGSEHDRVWGFNFLPETALDRNLGLRETLHHRIQEIHDTIGEDSAILDRTEQLNEEAMYAIYEKKGGQLSLFEDEEDEFVDLNEAEEILRQLQKDDPAEFDRIASLRDGIRAVKPAATPGMYVFCQAGRYQQLFLLDEHGETVSRDIPRVLGAIKCGPELKGKPVPAGYNARVMRVKRLFAEEVKHREAEREHTLSLTHGQRYVLRELRVLFGACDDEDMKAQINILAKAFRSPMTRALARELNRIRRNALTGKSLFRSLTELYHQHNMREWLDRQSLEAEGQPIPRIVCSEELK